MGCCSSSARPPWRLVFGRGSKPDQVESFPFGVASLQELLGGQRRGAVSREARREVESRVRSALAPFASRCTFAGPYPLVLAGRQIAALAPLVGDDPCRVTFAEVRALAMALEGLSVAEVGRLNGDVFPTASWTATLVASLLAALGASVARVSTAAACEGLLADWPQNPTRAR